MENATSLPDTPAAPLALGPELTIAQAAAWRETLVDALCTTPQDLALDLASVTDIDSAGIQLLLATRRSVLERGGQLTLVSASAAVGDALAAFGLDDELQETSSGAAA